MTGLKRTSAFVLLGLWLTAAAPGDVVKPIRLAVIPGEGDRAPKVGIVELLTADLSKQDDLVLLERAEIGKVLAEEGLTAGGLADPKAMVKLARIVSADLFVFMERLTNTTPAALRIQITEATTGIALGSVLQPEKSFDTDRAELAQYLKQALAKVRAPEKDRRYVGILGFRSEEPGHALEGFAAALGSLLAVDLNRSPAVLLLDREHLDRLTQEHDLTGMDLKLRLSAVLLDGGIRRTPGTQDGTVTIAFKSFGVETLEPARIQVPIDDIVQSRKIIVEHVVRTLKTARPTEGQAAPEQEAQMFFRRASILSAHGENGVPAAEAAYALAPSQERLYLVASLARGIRSLELMSQY